MDNIDNDIHTLCRECFLNDQIDRLMCFHAECSRVVETHM